MKTSTFGLSFMQNAPLPLWRDSIRRNGGFCFSFVLLCLTLVLKAPAADAANPTSLPFLRLRETTLGYHGPSEDFTNLTEIRIGWFGPTNLHHPLTDDIWWAASHAISEANAGARSADVQSAVSRFFNPQGVGDSRAPRSTESLAEYNSAIQQIENLRYEAFARLPVRLIPRWAVDPWGTGVSQLTRMVYDEQPLALLGSVDSASTHLAEQVVAKANLPLVSPIATDKSVTLAGVSWMFSCAPSDAAIARVLVDDILATLEGGASSPIRSSRRKEAPTEQSEIDQSLLTSAATKGKTSLALLACGDHESRMTAREVIKELSRRGHVPDFRFDVPPGAQAIARQISALEQAKPDVVLIIAGADDAARGTRAVRDKLGAIALFGSHAMGRTRFRELAGPAAEGVRFPLLFMADRADAVAVRFIEQFTQARDHAPDYTAAFTYDATRLLIEAIRRAGPNRARVREALTQFSPWPGIAGVIHFDGTGQNTRTNMGMGTIRDGALVPLPSPSLSTQSASSHPPL